MAPIPERQRIAPVRFYLLALLCDVAALAGGYGAVLPLSGASRAGVYAGLSLAAVCFLALCGHYSGRVAWWSQVGHVGRAVLFAALADGFAGFLSGRGEPAGLLAWAAAFVLMVAARLCLYFVRRRARAPGIPAVIVAGAEVATDALYALESDRGAGLAARTLLLQGGKLDREELPRAHRDIEAVTDAAEHEAYIRAHPDMFYIVSLEGMDGARRDGLVRLFQQEGIAYALIPAVSGASIYRAAPHYFFGNDIVLLNANRPGAVAGRVMKRAFDIVGASAALVVFAVPVLVVVILLKLEGQRGFPFYGGRRVGQGGRLFRCWKFETMGPDTPETDKILADYLAANPEAKAYWDRYFKLPDDPRIRGRTARFIRKASIDELPQLWNVLKGEMSLVGPRPILPSEVEAYGEKYAEYISAKPGITGLWQVSGRNNTSFRRRVIWDSWYVRNWTLWSDFVILARTVQAVFSRSGAS